MNRILNRILQQINCKSFESKFWCLYLKSKSFDVSTHLTPGTKLQTFCRTLLLPYLLSHLHFRQTGVLVFIDVSSFINQIYLQFESFIFPDGLVFVASKTNDSNVQNYPPREQNIFKVKCLEQVEWSDGFYFIFIFFLHLQFKHQGLSSGTKT